MAKIRKMPDENLRITAVVCIDAWDEQSPEAICSLRRQSLSHNFFEILVVGDTQLSSHLDSLSAEGMFPGLRHIRSSSTSKTELRSLAVAQARAPIVAFLDRQATAMPNWLASFCRTFDQFGDRATVVGGRVLPVWEIPRPGWLSDQLLAELSLVDLGDEARFVEAGEHIAAVNFAVRKSSRSAVNRFAQADRFWNIISADAVGCESRQGSYRDIYDPLAAVAYGIKSEDLDQRHFRTHAAWRAVASVLRADPAPAEDVDKAWRAAKAFFLTFPPSDRTVRALTLPQNDSNRFANQLAAIHDVFFGLLRGVSETDDE